MTRMGIVLLCGSLGFGCATTFTGEAHVEGGPAGCASKCRAWGLEFEGMVAMGEYSDACICRVPGKTVAMEDVGSVTGGVAGVAMQQERSRRSPQ